MQSVYQRVVQAGEFCPDADPLDPHMSISSLCFFTVSNRPAGALVRQRELIPTVDKRPAALAGLHWLGIVPYVGIDHLDEWTTG